MRLFNQLSLLAFPEAAAVSFYTCVALQVKEETKILAKSPHVDFTGNIPNCFGTETSGHLLFCIAFEGAKRVSFIIWFHSYLPVRKVTRVLVHAHKYKLFQLNCLLPVFIPVSLTHSNS